MGSGLHKETRGYRPLLLTSFALNYYLGGLDVFSYHLLNFFLHVLCSILVFFITLFSLRITCCEKAINPIRHQLTALFAALIFAGHPVQTESITYITGRSSLMTALFFMAAFWSYTQYGLNGKIYNLLLSSFYFVCALLVKETAVTLIAVLILFNLFFPLGRTWKSRLFSLIPYILISIGYLIIRIYFFGSLKYYSQPIRPFYDNILTQLRAWIHALGTLVLPLNLNVDYDFSISRSILEKEVLFSIFVLIAVSLVIWKISKSFRPVGFFALWFAINLAPTSSIIPLEDVFTDRWLYLPSVGFAVIAAFAAEWISRAKVIMNTRAVKLVFFFVCALVIELYGFSTFLRNFTWTSNWTLWEDAAAKSPNKARPHINLGLSLTEAGFYEEGITKFTRAIELNPRHGQAYLNLGYTYYMMGKIPEAINAYEKALVLSPSIHSEGHNNLGLAYLQGGRIEEGLKELQKAIEARPNNANPYYNLGKYYAQKGETDQAIFYLERAAQIEPEFFHIHTFLSQVYEKKGWRDKSREAHKNFIKYAPFGKDNPLKK